MAYSDSSAAAGYLLLGYSLSEVGENVIWYPIGVSALVLGYYSSRWRPSIERFWIFNVNEVSTPRLLLGCIIFGLIGLVGIGLYISANGINLSDGVFAVSSKKALTFEVDGDTIYWGRISDLYWPICEISVAATILLYSCWTST